MGSLGPRKFTRGVFRGYVEELKRMDIFDAVRAGASPDLVAVLDHPQRLPSWIDHTMLEEVLRAVVHLGGRSAVRDLGYNVIKRAFGNVFEPIIHTALRVIGGGPAALYSRAHLMLSVSTRGIEMEWVPSGPTSGTMQIRCDAPMPELGWITWEGTLVYGLELAKALGTVSEGRQSPDGKSCEIDVSWTSGKTAS